MDFNTSRTNLMLYTPLMISLLSGEFDTEVPSTWSTKRFYSYVIPIVAFGFIGIEAVAVTAFEAAPESLRRPSKIIAYFASILYLVCMLSQTFNVSWKHPDLPEIYSGIGEVNKRAENSTDPLPMTTILAVIAVREWKKLPLAGFLNGAIIFSVLSASNTALYIASRTLYGMAFRMDDRGLARRLRHFSKIDRTTGVPLPALITSWISFIWVPFLSLANDGYVRYASVDKLVRFSADNLLRPLKSYKQPQVLVA
jgi:amino acid transporter